MTLTLFSKIVRAEALYFAWFYGGGQPLPMNTEASLELNTKVHGKLVGIYPSPSLYTEFCYLAIL